GTTSGERRSLPWVWAVACLAGGWIGWALPVADAVEFSADQITRSQSHTRKANIYYRDDRWRLEHYALGPVNVTIVRKDKQVMWLLLSRIRHFKTVPYDPDQEPKVEERLKGETAREIIGTETRDGHPTTLYQVTVQDGGGEQIYYQWVATDIGFPLKLARKDGSWMVEYRNLRLRPQSDALFELPVNFKPLEELERKDEPS
ncbi:MAG: hypothetical protein ACREA0_28080, partial [bacterium]